MKNLKLFIAAACFVATAQGYSQPFYGQLHYTHVSSELSSAEITSRSAGYIMSGFTAVLPNINNDNFVIDKVDGDGAFSTGFEFSNGYRIQDDIYCSAVSQINNCNGVSVIEIPDLGRGDYYAVAGSYNQGIFFCTLDQAGNVIPASVFRWDLPSAWKPRIAASANTGFYYITSDAYAMKIDANPATPTQVWCNIYTAGPIFNTRDLIENPWNTNELIIVGRTDNGVPTYPNSTAADAFFLKVDANAGNPLLYNTYNRMWDGDEWFSCIEPATCSQAEIQAGFCTDDQPGSFILGGRSHFPYQQANCSCVRTNNLEMTQWMCKLDPNGNVMWSTLIEPYASSQYNLYSGGEISDVGERMNPNGSLEYYGVAGAHILPDLASASYAVMENVEAYKLDQSGLNSLSPNEFHYTQGSAANYQFSNAELTLIETAGGPDDGIQVYGNDLPNQQHYFNKGYFNGVTGCNEVHVDMDAVHVGPQLTDMPPISATPYTPNCPTMIQFQVNNLGTSTNTLCWATNDPNGSNARAANATALAAQLSNAGNLSVYPNPTSGKATVELGALSGDVSITVLNALGQQVQQMHLNATGGEKTAEIDFSGLGAQEGVYFVNVSANGTTSHFKVVYAK